VIRVNRISYNGGDPRTANYTQPLPDVDVPVRIDCETPEAEIRYGLLPTPGYYNGPVPDSFTWNSGTMGGPETVINGRKNFTIDDAALSSLNSVKTTNAYTGPFYAGAKNGTAVSGTAGQAFGNTDPLLFKARKDYVAAVAKRNTRPALAKSEPSYEGVFKTVIMFKGPYRNSAPLTRLRLSGENHTLAGFPFPQTAVFDENYGKDMYLIPGTSATGGGRNNFLWISWEIMDEWSHVKSYGYRDGVDSGYGQVIEPGAYGANTYYSGYGMLAYRYHVEFCY
jgi:hypothetical protein